MERKVNDSNKARFQRKPGFRDRVRTSMFALTLKSLPIALGFVLEASAVKFMGFDSLLAEARGKRLVADGTVPSIAAKRQEGGGQAETPNLDLCSPFFLQVEAVIWRDGQIQQVLPPLGGSVGVVNAINDNGQAVGIVGIAGCVTGNLHAVLWQRRTPIDLGN